MRASAPGQVTRCHRREEQGLFKMYAADRGEVEVLQPWILGFPPQG